MKTRGRLLLIPADLGSDTTDHVWPAGNLSRISHIRHFIVENDRTARRFLRKAGFTASFDDVALLLLNKHTSDKDASGFLDAAEEGHDTGLLSEAGMPCVADPGQKVVAMAHRRGIAVVPLVGPGSVLLALMASGFSGQRFVFHGYLPIDSKARIRALQAMEREAYRLDQTQIFMETPYRNDQLMKDLLQACLPGTLLCVACDLTLPTEFIRTHPMKEWKKNMPGLHKRPGMFLLFHP